MPKPHKHRDRDGRAVPAVPASDQPMTQFFAQVPIDEFVEAVELRAGVKGSTRLKTFAQALMDPRFRRYRRNTLAARCDVTLDEMHDMYRDYQIHRGLLAMAARTPRVMADVAADSESTQIACACGNKPECQECGGSGYVRQPGSSDARRLLFDTMGLLKRAPTVAIQQNFGDGVQPIEQTAGEAQRLLDTPKR